MSRFVRKALEEDLESRCRRYVKRRGGHLLKTVTLGTTGFPDRLLVLPRMHFLVEFKREGRKPTKVQAHWHTVLRAAGFEVWVIDDYDMFVWAVDHALACHPTAYRVAR